MDEKLERHSREIMLAILSLGVLILMFGIAIHHEACRTNHFLEKIVGEKERK